ncbi:Tat-linked quality control protein TatD [compost metagenome]
MTFKNGGLDRFLADIPLEKIVLETDAPYLAPVPYRGKRNEPAYLEQVLSRLSEIYNADPAYIRAVTTQTAQILIS